MTTPNLAIVTILNQDMDIVFPKIFTLSPHCFRVM